MKLGHLPASELLAPVAERQIEIELYELRQRKGELTEELGGDKIHDAGFYDLERLERELLVKQRTFRSTFHPQLILEKPDQFKQIMVGHMVKVFMPEDDETSWVHILSEFDRLVLKKYQTPGNRIVEAASDIAVALLGKTIGARTETTRGYPLHILRDPKAIAVSTFFDFTPPAEDLIVPDLRSTVSE
jgi:hypothetical protein